MSDSARRRWVRFFRIIGWTIGLAGCLFPGVARAYQFSLPPSIAQEALSESIPTAIAPVEFDTRDFAVEWIGESIPGVRLELEENSLQWTRVIETLVIPRARLRIRAENAQGGGVSHAGFSQPLAIERSSLVGRIPVALISGEENPITIRIVRGGKQIVGRAVVRFHPRRGANFVFVDPSCSRFHVDATIERQESSQPHWTTIGCRMQISESTDHRTMTLETYVFWDGAGKSIRIGGADVPSTSPSLWPLRLSSAPGSVMLEADGESVAVRYSTPEKLHLASLGLGLGPYSYHFEGPDTNSTNPAGLLTIYGSYSITETIRFVAFDATALSQHGTTDFGLYLNTENFRILDRRLSLSLLLGGHALYFRNKDQDYFLWGAPQGVELIYTDAFKRGRNLSMGAFIYPSINDRSYYNVWLRWGGRIFGELNYISWEEKTDDTRFSSRSVGVSLGLPIAQFF